MTNIVKYLHQYYTTMAQIEKKFSVNVIAIGFKEMIILAAYRQSYISTSEITSGK